VKPEAAADDDEEAAAAAAAAGEAVKKMHRTGPRGPGVSTEAYRYSVYLPVNFR
jgi:hypothetical protein